MGTCMRQYTGFSWVFEKEEQAIILEDDCIPKVKTGVDWFKEHYSSQTFGDIILMTLR